ncbi:hypothetical protein C7447_101527 [Tenacibaculum adriaticum]|uniref:Uncharacterized protein n=1 Tax=Tenacibaculum adriaticum TaxID=413713 RepID=A0A5S5DV99_9FLAO|nr:hypothetical protein [Tenacibaculum adriaticum]TYP99920.1 hypothetical protein C7447_101527 [Tenacibaculum adriaticum]
MFLYQNLEKTDAYKAGYETGKWVAHHPTVSVIIGVLLLAVLIWGFIKVVKQIRTFGE